MTPCDVICLYTKMNRNFKGGMDNVMIEYNDTVDSPELQRCRDGHHSSLLREKGRFGYVDTTLIGCTGARFFSSRSGRQDRLYKERS